ncbi:MAG: cation:proton antiporter [Vicinamibacterales bacterium]
MRQVRDVLARSLESMDAHGLLPQLVLTAIVALAALLVAGRLKIPALVALILAGIAVGPSALAVVPTREDVDVLAEIGVVLLMFTVGLEFSFVAMRPMLGVAIFGGTLQIGLTMASIVVALHLALHNLGLELFVGLFVALTSTAILLKELAARNIVNAPQGRLVVAVALLQDVASVLILALLPVLAGGNAEESLSVTLLRTLLALGGVGLFGVLILPRLIRLVSFNRSREAFSLAVVVVSLGTAWFTSQLGVSMALGAFLAGLVLAESEFSHQIHAEIRPLRDILTSLFFISVGMIIDLHALLPRLPIVLAAAVGLVFVKALASATALLIVRVSLRPAVVAGIFLVPVGEFSFVLGRSALDLGLLSPELWQILLGTSVLTMVAAPWLVQMAPEVGQRLVERFSVIERTPPPVVERLQDHVVIIGFGVGGQMIARALREIGTKYLILDLNGATVQQATQQGEPIVYGDAANPDTVHAAALHHAKAVVVTINDPDATLRAVRTIRALEPELPIIARSRYRVEAARLQQAGATLAVAEELEASLEVLAQLLMILGIPGNALQLLLDVFRRDSTAGRPLTAPTLSLASVPEEVQRSPVATHRLDVGHWAVGRTLGSIELRAVTGATVLAIQVGEQYVTNPTAGQDLQAGSVLFLMGDESDILLARSLLTDGPRERGIRPA